MKQRKQNRLKGFKYSSDARYFVTICVQDRICCFGFVNNDPEMVKKDLGKIVESQWNWLISHENIIGTQKSFINIENYITENPVVWENDKYFVKN